MIFDTFHTPNEVFMGDEGGFEERNTFEYIKNLLSSWSDLTLIKRILHLSMDMMLKISELTSIVFSELFKKSFDVKQGFD